MIQEVIEEAIDDIKQFITSLMVAISNCSLYTKEHEAFDMLAKRVHLNLDKILMNKLDIMILDNELVINRTPIRDSGIHCKNLINRLKKNRISRIYIDKGVSIQEIKQMIIELAGSGRGLKKLPHIRFGSVDINMVASMQNSDEVLHPAPKDLEKVKDIIQSASPFKKLNVIGLEEVVVNFIYTFKKEAGILKLLCPVKTYDEYTYTHATNVAVLSVFQAQSLGLGDEILHQIGIAGLLHDVGKMFVSKEIVDKKGKLTEAEFAEMQNHPLHGARYLLKIDRLPRIAPVVAYEHHMNYDGSGYPRHSLNGKPQKQQLYSQIVAISDFFDALRSNRPYRKEVDTKEILALMKKCEGKYFNPFLIDNFIKIMETSPQN